jgi:hypothetical protein
MPAGGGAAPQVSGTRFVSFVCHHGAITPPQFLLDRAMLCGLGFRNASIRPLTLGSSAENDQHPTKNQSSLAAAYGGRWRRSWWNYLLMRRKEQRQEIRGHSIRLFSNARYPQKE